MNQKRARVALAKGDSRYDNVRRVLELIAADIDLTEKQRVLIKPNFVSTIRQLAATHLDAVRAVLDFLKERHVGKVVIAEGADLGGTFEGFRNFGYMNLPQEYGVELVDLHQQGWIEVQALDRQFRPITLRVSKYLAESDYRISVGPPKTHESTIVTLSAKNMAVASLVKDHLGNERQKFHQGYQAINLNLYRVVRHVYPHLAVIDGFQGMDGDGPVSGDPVDLRVAIASTDFVAADSMAASIMGQDPTKVGYITYCHRGGLGQADLGQIDIVGRSLEECRQTFQRHPDYETESHWEVPQVEQYL